MKYFISLFAQSPLYKDIGKMNSWTWVIIVAIAIIIILAGLILGSISGNFTGYIWGTIILGSILIVVGIIFMLMDMTFWDTKSN